MALNELLLYRQTKLTPDKVKKMKKELDYYKREFCYIKEQFHEPTGKPVGLIFKINLIGTTCKTDRISLALSE